MSQLLWDGGRTDSLIGWRDRYVERVNRTLPEKQRIRRFLNRAELDGNEVNAGGGICDRRVEIVVKDHGYDVQKAVTAYADISADVVALPQVIGSPVMAALLDDIERDKVLTFPQAWAASLLDRDSVQVLGTTYDIDMIAAVDFLTRTKGLAKGDTIGHVYFEGDYGENALAGTTPRARTTTRPVTALPTGGASSAILCGTAMACGSPAAHCSRACARRAR